MDRTERVELTTMILVEDKEKYNILLQNRVKKDYQGYTLPGGHIEPGESIVEAAARELKEETGLIAEPENLELCGVKQFPIEGGRYLVFLFKTFYNGIQEVVSSSEGQMEWINKNNLESIHKVDDFDSVMWVFNSNVKEFIRTKDKWMLR